MRRLVALGVLIAAGAASGYSLLGSPDPRSLSPYAGLVPHVTQPDPNWFWPSNLPRVPSTQDITRLVPPLPKSNSTPGVPSPDPNEIQRMRPNPNDALPWLQRPSLNAVPGPDSITKQVPDKNWFLPSTPRAPKPEDLKKQLPDPNWYMPVTPRVYF